ncbi:2-octaprenyl-6-methoxyphenyl hydroxylase [Aliivibrio kagoshimensis]|uniref:2-octaprenyl-6-methoxyphenyl hydroxylase n=1 Tax=Aliivibrio kagoshimensis TaxID=2910230 RepID=UPI003D0A4C33
MNNAEQSNREYDVVIVGGAMAGATLALTLDTLAKGTLSIAVIEAVEPNVHTHPGYDSRSIALSYGTVRLLESVGLWSSIKPAATAIKQIHISDRGHFGQCKLDATSVGVDALGYVVELSDVGSFYHHELQQRKQIDLFCPVTIKDIERTESSCVVTLSNDDKIVSSLLVAADGGDSLSCQLLQHETHHRNFEQTAIIANVSSEVPHSGKAFERFTEHGPIALLPMSEGRNSLVWCLKPDDAAEIMTLNEPQFLAKLQQAFGWRLGELTHTGHRVSYPLVLKQVSPCVSHRFAVVGNAAQALHPIAGQGFNLGIRDVFTLAEEMISAKKNAFDIGDYSVLNRFMQRREADRHATITMTSGLLSIFANQYWPLVAGRNLSLSVSNHFQTLLTPLTHRAMGEVKR